MEQGGKEEYFLLDGKDDTMKNILHQTAFDEQHGRTKCILSYVSENDVRHKKVLDIGCGFGWFEYHMLQKGADHIWGIDLTEEDVHTAAASLQDDRVTFMVGSGIALPFEDEYFDCVVSWDVLEHIPAHTEKKMFQEIARVLKKKGTFYISTPYRSLIGTFLDPAWWLIGHRHYTKEFLYKLTDRIPSLEIEKMEVRGGVFDVLGILNMYIAKWAFRRKSFFKEFFDRKMDKEYERDGGLNTLFVKGTKI